MAPTTPVRGTATLANDAPIAPRCGRPSKPTERIREAQVNLGLRTIGTRAATQRAILPAITVAPANGQQNDNVDPTDAPACDGASQSTQNTEPQDFLVEELKGYRAVIQALSGELREAQKDRQTQATIIQALQTKLQGIDGAVKEAGEEARRMGEIVRRAGEEARMGWDEARKGWEEVKRAREEAELAIEETQMAREAAKAAEEKVVTLQKEMGAMKEEVGASLQKLCSDMAAWSSQPPSWASVAAGSSQSGSRVSFDLSERSSGASYSPSESLTTSTPRESPTTSLKSAFKNSTGRPNDTKARLTIDLGKLNNEDVTRLDSAAKIRQRLEEGLKSIGELSEVKVTDFKMWNTNSMVKVIRFEVAQEQEKKVREHSETWMRSHLRGARLVEAPRHRIKIHWVDKAYATDASTGHMREDVAEIFGRENNVNVHSMRWLSTPRDNAMHASAVVSLDTMEEAERLLSREEITFGGSTVQASQFVLRPRPTVCYHCAKIGHAAKKCNRPPQCTTCGEIGHSICEAAEEKCANCAGPHRATDRTCPEYVNEMERLKTVHHG